MNVLVEVVDSAYEGMSLDDVMNSISSFSIHKKSALLDKLQSLNADKLVKESHRRAGSGMYAATSLEGSVRIAYDAHSGRLIKLISTIAGFNLEKTPDFDLIKTVINDFNSVQIESINLQLGRLIANLEIEKQTLVPLLANKIIEDLPRKAERVMLTLKDYAIDMRNESQEAFIKELNKLSLFTLEFFRNELDAL